jgi:hypothetical protein
MNYVIFILFTDGGIDDLQDTINLIVEGSKLPLSILIIGLGGEDFSNMDTLDADDKPLISSKGDKMSRDIVQFVEFDRIENNVDILKSCVLEEIP